jgi:O-antigen ligase/polysaccharide polymerase Wzy-like membrane protein
LIEHLAERGAKRPNFMNLGTLFRRLLACVVFAAIVVAVVDFPFVRLPIVLGLTSYALILFRYSKMWLIVIPALLPVLDLTPWSGRFFFEEFDFFVLTTIAVLLWRKRPAPTHSKLSTALKIVLGLLTLSYLISLYLGLFPLEPLDANAFANYFSHYNALRVVKGFVWALALICVARGGSSLFIDHAEDKRLFALGMVLGLVALNLAVLYERFLFAGILNFNTDLRAIATFSGLHNGGNDIEAYLVFTAPFIVAWVFDTRHIGRYLLGIILFIFSSYSLFVTFSRGGYLGFAVAWFVLVICLIQVARSQASSLSSLRVPLFAVLLVFVGGAVALPILKGDFIRARFATVALDWQSRVDQLQNTFQMMAPDLLTTLFGTGLGRYPSTYLAQQASKSLPTVYTFEKEPNNSFLRVKAGSPLYFGQWIKIEPNQSYRLSLDLRATKQKGTLSVPICEKQIQQSFRCQSVQFQTAGTGAWEHFEQRFNMGEVGGDVGRIAGRLSRRPVELALYNPVHRSILDIDNVRLLNEAGTNLISNGDFSKGQDRWFFTVDDLLPWQSSNHWGQIFFEQGGLGLVAFNLFILYLVMQAVAQIRRGDVFAAVVLSGSVGFLVVGLFGSLFDTPRLATLFFIASMLPLLGNESVAATSLVQAQIETRAAERRISFGRLASSTLLLTKSFRVMLAAIGMAVPPCGFGFRF